MPVPGDDNENILRFHERVGWHLVAIPDTQREKHVVLTNDSIRGAQRGPPKHTGTQATHFLFGL